MCSVAVGPATRGQLLCNVTGPIHRYATLRSTQQRRSWPRVARVHATDLLHAPPSIARDSMPWMLVNFQYFPAIVLLVFRDLLWVGFMHRQQCVLGPQYPRCGRSEETSAQDIDLRDPSGPKTALEDPSGAVFLGFTIKCHLRF